MNKHILSIRTYFRKHLLDVLSCNATPKDGIHILNGHILSLNDNAGSVVFENLIIDFKRKGVELINYSEAVDKIVSREIPNGVCYIAFSFDDGFKECFTKIKPALDKFNIKAAFFINPNFIDGDENYKTNFRDNIVFTKKDPMNWEEIKILSKEGHLIGSHTLDHINLNTSNKELLISQLKGSKEIIEKKLGNSCDHFAIPFGTLKHISEIGVEIALGYYSFVYSQSNYRKYFSFNGKVINRRHFECDWPLNHIFYFLKSKSF